MVTPLIEQLEALGFKEAARNTEIHQGLATPELKQKLRTAFEHFRVVEPSHFDRFAKELKEKTLKQKTLRRATQYDGALYERSWLRPKLTSISKYPHVPPQEVLDKLAAAINLKCFDSYDILTLDVAVENWRGEPRRAPIDPVLFGRMDESPNYYCIAQWDTDVAIEDILREDEG